MFRLALSNSPKILVFDTTVVGRTFRISDVLAQLQSAPLLAIDVCSGLKLHQQGLELANVGFACMFGARKDAGKTAEKDSQNKLRNQLMEQLKLARQLTGSGLTLMEAAALDAAFVTDSNEVKAYSSRVFEHNQLLADSIEAGKYFSKVIYAASVKKKRNRAGARLPGCVF